MEMVFKVTIPESVAHEFTEQRIREDIQDEIDRAIERLQDGHQCKDCANFQSYEPKYPNCGVCKEDDDSAVMFADSRHYCTNFKKKVIDKKGGYHG